MQRSNRRPRSAGRRIAAVLLLLLVLAAGFPTVWGPWLAEVVLRRQADAAGLSGIDVAIRRITPWNLEAGPLVAVDPLQPLLCRRLSLDYSPAGLLRRELRGLTLEGIQAGVVRTGGTTTVCGVAWPSGRTPAARGAPAWQVDRLGVRDARVRWFGEHPGEAPVDAVVDLSATRREASVYDVDGSLTDRRRRARGAGRVDLGRRTGSVSLKLDPFEGRGGREPSGLAWSVPSATLEAAVEDGGNRVNALLAVNHASLRHGPLLAVSNLTASLPLAWGRSEGPRIGDVDVQWTTADIGRLALVPGAVRARAGDAGAALSLPLSIRKSRLAPALNVEASWRDGLRWVVGLEVPETRVEASDALQDPLRRLLGDGVTFSGTLAASAALASDEGQRLFSGRLMLQAAAITDTNRGWRVNGLATTIAMPEQILSRNIPLVSTTFTDADIRGIPFGAGRVDWQALPGALLIERAQSEWCGGTVRLNGLRLARGMEEADGQLLFEQIELGQLLQLLKPLDGTGQGQLHGRVPLRIVGGRIRLSDGFLYSLPGERGTLQLRDTRLLDDALARTRLPAQVRRGVSQALRDLEYTVFRLDLQPREGRDVVLKIRLAGESARDKSLPPVDLNVNVNGPLEVLLNAGVQMNKATSADDP